MIENQINVVMAIAYLDWILLTNKGKTFAEFKKKLLHVIYQSLLKTKFSISFLCGNT